MLRNRVGEEIWGLKHLSKNQRRKVDGDSVLILRQLQLFWTAYKGNGLCSFLLEHPSDPAQTSRIPGSKHCPSLWAIPEIRMFFEAIQAELRTNRAKKYYHGP